MKNHLLISFIYIFYLIISSCSAQESTVNSESRTDLPYMLKLKTKKIFHLDSLTAPVSRSIQIYKDSEQEITYFCFLNQLDNSIYFYNYHSTDFLFKVKFPKEGVNSIKNMDSFYIHNFDTILVHEYYGRSVHLVNKNADKIESYSLISEQFPASVNPSSTASPIIFKDGKIYLSSPGNSKPNQVTKDKESLLNPVLELTLSSKKIIGKFQYPESYLKGAFGMIFHDFYVTYFPDSRKFIYSFPIDDYLYETDFEGKVAKHLARSIFQYKDTEPMLDKETSSKPSYQEKRKYYLTSFSYKGVFADLANGYIFRIAELPVSETEFSLNDPVKSTTKKLSILIFDNTFRKIGEIKMPDYEYNPEMITVSPDGLCIARNNKEDEDILILDVFEVVKSDGK